MVFVLIQTYRFIKLQQVLINIIFLWCCLSVKSFVNFLAWLSDAFNFNQKYPESETVVALGEIKADVNQLKKKLESLIEHESKTSKLLCNCRLFYLVNEVSDHVLVLQWKLNGHSRKGTALPRDLQPPSQNPVCTPIQILYLHIPVSGHSFIFKLP